MSTLEGIFWLAMMILIFIGVNNTTKRWFADMDEITKIRHKQAKEEQRRNLKALKKQQNKPKNKKV